MTPPSVPLVEEPDAGPSFVVELADYSGPLDLLLTLIREEEVDIADIPIARVAAQFLERIHSLGLNEAAEYLEMAARLLRIKAQMLLPRREDGESWEDPRAELVRRLLEYQQVRELVGVLERKADERRNRFSRAYAQTFSPPPAPLALSLAELLSGVDRVLRMASQPLVHTIVARPLDVDGAMQTVRSALALRDRLRWRELLSSGAERWRVLSMLLALLELARRGELRLKQDTPFTELEILRDAAGQAA